MDLLITLLSVDTSSGGGRQALALALARDHLLAAGVEEARIEGDAAPYLFAQVPGRRPRSGILLFSHVDTDGWDAGAWTRSPLGEVDRDGMIWGRGTLDCKSIVAVHVHLLARVARSRSASEHPVGIVVTTDEETGEGGGMRAFCRDSKRLGAYTEALGEGGGYILSAEPRSAVTCQIGECGRLVYPAPGAADAPEILLGVGHDRPASRLPRVPGASRISLTAALPAFCVRDGVARVRVPPRYSRERIEAELAARGLLPRGATCRVSAEPQVTAPRGRLYRRIRRLVREQRRTLVPVVTPGFGDGRHLREAGILTFGFFPVGLRERIVSMHSPDEGIHTRTVLEAQEALWRLVAPSL